MAQKTLITLLDDLDGSEAEETITLALDGVEYEIDLNAKNAKKLRTALKPYVEAGRHVGKAGKAGKATLRKAASKKAGIDRSDREAIRAFAESQGYGTVSDRGRISSNILSAWEEAGRPAA